MEAGSITKAFISTPSPSALNLLSSWRPTWEAIGPEIGRTSSICEFGSYAASLWTGFDRRANRLRIRGNGRTEAGNALCATQALHNVLAYLKKIDSENEFHNLQNHFSAKYDHFNVHEARLEQEFKGAAWLRAEAYSEQQAYTRYVDSFTKKFAEQEFSALKRRVSGQPGSYVCLIAVSKALPKDAVDLTWQDGKNVTRVLGTLDVSLHHPSAGEAFGGQGLPYGYISNVCVDKSARKQGIASTLMECAVQVGRDWGLNAIYVHTHTTNEPAFKLYVKKGYEVLGAGCPQKLVDGNLLLRLQL